jgi:hypothetical protein
MRLSILICHMRSRAALLEELMELLEPQLNDITEVLVDSGPGTVGAKRNRLLAQATGEYVAYVDDDDRISEIYVPGILNALRANPDCVGIRGYLIQGGSVKGMFEHSIRYKSWENVDNGGILRWVRPPNHLNPVKASIARAAGFPEISHGEDQAYSEAIRGLVNTEVMINVPIYLYVMREKPAPLRV